MTTTTDHDELLPLLAGEVLGGLDDVETRRLATHRAGCERCADESMALAELVVDLGLTAPPRSPSSTLAGRVADVAREEATAVAVSHADRGWRAFLRRPALAVATASIAVVLAVTAAGLAFEGARLTDAVAVQGGLIAVLADPTHVRAPLVSEDDPDVTAMAVFVPGSTQSYVMATGLAPTPADHVYQLWAADDAGVHPLGTFTYDGNGPFVAPFGVNLARRRRRWSPWSRPVVPSANQDRRSSSASCRPRPGGPTARVSDSSSLPSIR